MAWTITGEAGKALDATERTLEELGISGALLSFRSLDADTLTWTAQTEGPATEGTLPPAHGQVVELFFSGARKFRGHVTAVRVRTNTVLVTVSGPWWWMTRTPLTSDQTDAQGRVAERQKYVFPTGDLATMVRTLIDRAIANGVPMSRGGVAAMYDVSRVTLSETHCAEALAQLLGRVPDALTRFDYSGSAGSLPVLQVHRRNGASAMTPLGFTRGVSILEHIDIAPRLDLEVTRTEIAFVQRDTVTGKPRYASQASGTTATGKRQIVTVSGPEIVDFLPLDDFATARVKTVAAVTSQYVADNDSALAAIKKEFGIEGQVQSTLSLFSGYLASTASGSSKSPQIYNFPGLSYMTGDGKFLTDIAGKYIVISPDLPTWAREQYGAQEVTITGTWVATANGRTRPWSAAFTALRAGARTGNDFSNSDISGGNQGDTTDWLARPFTVQALLIHTSFPIWSSIYKAWDYDYITPPAGMAEGIRLAQAWVPWEGEFTEVRDEVTGDNRLNRTINLAGSLPECASMAAMLRGMTHDIMRGRTTYELGAPARSDFGTAMGRVSLSPQDVIVEL